VRYKQSVLGWIWAVAQPLALMVVFTAVFSNLGRIPTDSIPYPIFTLAGLLPWAVFSSSVANGTNAVVHYGYLLTRVYFPREIIAFTYVLMTLFDFVIQFLLLIGILLYYHLPVTPRIVYVVPVMLCLAMSSAAAALLLAA